VAGGAIKYRIARADVLRRSEGTCFSFASDDEVGGLQRAIRAERAIASEAIKLVARDPPLIELTRCATGALSRESGLVLRSGGSRA
jgi:hypothetical protein